MNISPVYNSLPIITNSTMKNNQFVSKKISQQINFSGAHYPSGYYTDEEIADAYRYLHVSDWKEKANINLQTRWKIGFLSYVFGDGYKKVWKHIGEVEKLQKDLIENEKTIAKEKQNQIDIEKLKPLKNQMKNDFFDIVELSRNNRDMEVPNGIMIESSDKNLVKKFLDWTLEQDTVTSIKITTENETNENIISEIKNIMDKSNQEYIQNNKRTLLHIDGFEKIASQKNENKGIIAALKALMCSCSERYKCTVLINAAEKNTIDPILLVDSRIKFRIKL